MWLSLIIKIILSTLRFLKRQILKTLSGSRGFIKATDNRAPTHRSITTYPPTRRLTIIQIIKTEDQIQNILFTR